MLNYSFKEAEGDLSCQLTGSLTLNLLGEVAL